MLEDQPGFVWRRLCSVEFLVLNCFDSVHPKGNPIRLRNFEKTDLAFTKQTTGVNSPFSHISHGSLLIHKKKRKKKDSNTHEAENTVISLAMALSAFAFVFVSLFK